MAHTPASSDHRAYTPKSRKDEQRLREQERRKKG